MNIALYFYAMKMLCIAQYKAPMYFALQWILFKNIKLSSA